MTENKERNEARDDAEVERDLEEKTNRLAEQAIEIGRMWTKHGLTVGKLALQTSARTLEATARGLADLAEKLGGKADDEGEKAA
jgi:hypothetical protein